MASRAQTIKWLRGLAEEGGKGVVNNIDARCLGRISDDLEQLQKALEGIRDQRDNENADIDAICNTAEQALRAVVGTVQVSGGE